MALELANIARSVGGSIVTHRHHERSLVDGLTSLQNYVVIGHPAFATLVTGPVHNLTKLLHDEERSEILSHAVFVTSAESNELIDLLESRHMTAIVGARDDGTALHAELATLIAEDQAADDRLVTAGTKVLTQVARRGGAAAVMAELAHRIDGWAVLIDAHGHLIASAGAGRLHIEDAVAVALGRPVRVRHQGLQTHQVGSDRDLVGYLIIASRSSVTSRNRDLASHAASLLDLVLRTRDPSVTDHLGRRALLDILHRGGEAAPRLLANWGVLDEQLCAFEVGARTRTIDLERLVTRWLDELSIEHVYARSRDRVQGFIPQENVDEFCARAVQTAPAGDEVVHLGIGKPAAVDALGHSATQARQALDAALDDGRQVVRFSALPSVDLVIDSLDREPLSQLEAVLDALREPSGAHGELTDTLRVYLAEHGGHRSSAAKLGIHRQTLVSRIHRVEELTGLSMRRPDDRATAWLALRALGY